MKLSEKQAITDMNVRSWISAAEHVYGHTVEALSMARKATPEERRKYEAPAASILGGPAEWEVYKPKPQPGDDSTA